MNTFEKQIETWIEAKELSPIRAVLGGFEKPGQLARHYRNLFPPHHLEAVQLVGAPLKNLPDERVLDRLEVILDKRSDVVRVLLQTWLDTYGPLLEKLAEGEWPFEGPPPRAAWWKAAAHFLEARDVHPEWTWFGRLAKPEPPKTVPPPAKPKQKDGRLEACRKALRDREEEIRALKKALAEKTAALNEAESRFQQLFAAKEEALKSARLEAMQLRQKLDVYKGRLERLSRAKDEVQVEMGDCRRTLAKLEQELSQAKGALEDCRQTLETTPEPISASVDLPFDPQDLSEVWVIPYAGLAGEPRIRLLGLIRLYRSALEDRRHPLFEKTNWSAIKGKPKGILLLDTDRLLHDLERLPLDRWLETSLFTTEAYLRGLERQVETALLEQQ